MNNRFAADIFGVVDDDFSRSGIFDTGGSNDRLRVWPFITVVPDDDVVTGNGMSAPRFAIGRLGAEISRAMAMARGGNRARDHVIQGARIERQ